MDDLTYHIASKHRERNQREMDNNLQRLMEFLNDNDLVINIGKMAILECMIKQKKGRRKGEPPQLIVQTEAVHYPPPLSHLPIPSHRR